MLQLLEYVRMAIINIRVNKARSLLTMLGITIGTAAVILLVTLGYAVKGKINTELDSLAGGIINIYVNDKKDSADNICFSAEDIEMLVEKVEHLKGVTPYREATCILTGRKGSFDGYVNIGNEFFVHTRKEPFITGRYFNKAESDSGKLVGTIRENTAKKLFGSTDVVGMTVEVTIWNTTREVTITGVREENPSMLRSMAYGSDYVVIDMPISAMAEFGADNMEVKNLYLICDSGEYTKEAAEKSVAILESKYGIRGQELIAIQNFDDSIDSINKILGYVALFIAFVAAISLLVGGIGVMNIMLVSVTERTREIGIRKALGARTASIMTQFLAESAIICMIGGIVGIVLGIGGAAAICTAIGFETVINPLTILTATMFSMSVGLFFGIYPARKAAKLSPIEALRHE